MPISPQDLVSKAIYAGQNIEWTDFTDYELKIKQDFADRHDWEGLECFYLNALRLGVSSDEFKKVVIKDIKSFESTITDVLARGLAIAAQRPEIKAIYFEYFFDGGESCTGDIFLCENYDLDDDDWASNFGEEGYIKGPNIFKYKNFDPKIDFEPIHHAISDAYVDACLLAAFGRVVDRFIDNHKLPFGFAQHDYPLIKIT